MKSLCAQWRKRWVGWAALCTAALFCACATHAENLPGFRLPELSDDSGTRFEKRGTTIDYGNTSQGYVMVMHSPSNKIIKLRVSMGKNSYTYDLNSQGEYEVFPLQMGDGKYSIQLFQEAKRGKYSPMESKSFQVKLDDPNIVYLYPNQYVDYGANSAAAAKSIALCQDLTTEAERVKAVYDFCYKQLVYHFERALNVKTGYLPNIDEVLADRKGICFDFSALMACMLRVQNVPAQLVIGNTDKGYHAWNNVLVGGQWYRYDATFASLGTSVKKYVEERRY